MKSHLKITFLFIISDLWPSKFIAMQQLSVKISYLLSYEINGYIEESNLKLVPTDENKDTLKMYEELWSKIRDLINSY